MKLNQSYVSLIVRKTRNILQQLRRLYLRICAHRFKILFTSRSSHIPKDYWSSIYTRPCLLALDTSEDEHKKINTFSRLSS